MASFSSYLQRNKTFTFTPFSSFDRESLHDFSFDHSVWDIEKGGILPLRWWFDFGVSIINALLSSFQVEKTRLKLLKLWYQNLIYGKYCLWNLRNSSGSSTLLKLMASNSQNKTWEYIKCPSFKIKEQIRKYKVTVF